MKTFLLKWLDTMSSERPHDWIKRVGAAFASPIILLLFAPVMAFVFVLGAIYAPFYFLLTKEPFKERDR